MADLKSREIRNAYDDLLTKGAGNTVEDGDGNPFDIFNRAFTAGGLVRLPSGLNFNASGGDTLANYTKGTGTAGFGGAGVSEVTYDFNTLNYVRIGDICFLWISIRTASLTKGTGAVTLTGLPFTAAAGIPALQVSAARRFGVASFANVFFRVAGGTTIVNIYTNSPNSSSLVQANQDFLNTGASQNEITISGWFEID